MPNSSTKKSPTGPWQDALLQSYHSALTLMEGALRDCPDELWEASMWQVPRPETWVPLPGPDGTVNEDPEFQERLLQGGSAVWNVAYHALWHLDYDISGGFTQWRPPEPFGAQDGGRVVTRTFTKAELMEYVRWSRRRAQQVFGAITDEEAATPLPGTHRYRGQSYASLLASIPRHVTEHASQIRQFITAAGVKPDALGDPHAGARFLRAAVIGASDEEITEWAQHFGGFRVLLGVVFDALASRVRPGSSDVNVAFIHGDNTGFVFRIVDGKGKVSKRVAKNAPAIFRSSPVDFLRLIVGDLDYEEALASGQIVIDGDESRVKNLLSRVR